MRIAIVGAGFCGIAVSWHLLHSFPHAQLVLFDNKGIGGGASGIAAGLLHPYAGAHSKLNRMGQEGMQASLHLLEVASQVRGKPVFSKTGILRPALTSMQADDFKRCYINHLNEMDWLDEVDCHRLFPDLTVAPALWIKPGISVDSPLYLQSLWQACVQKGAKLEIKNIHSLAQLKEFDLKILTVGASFSSFPALSSLSLSIVKGQVLEIEWPENLSPLSMPLNSQAYIIMNEKQRTCLAGATFEKDDLTPSINPIKAAKEILPKVIAMLPSLENSRIMNCYAGLRAVTRDHFPLIERIGNKEWALTGMGSKGLLYHALFAKKLVELIKQSLLF